MMTNFFDRNAGRNAPALPEVARQPVSASEKVNFSEMYICVALPLYRCAIVSYFYECSTKIVQGDLVTPARCICFSVVVIVVLVLVLVFFRGCFILSHKPEDGTAAPSCPGCFRGINGGCQ